MITQKLANANASTIQITTTATLLTTLLDTAAGVANNLPNGLDAVDLVVEGGDIRMLEDGNIPTATAGTLLKGNGSIHRLRGVALHQMYLISTSGSNVQASVTVGTAQAGDEESSDAINAALSGGSGSSGAIEASGSDGDSNANSEQVVDSRMAGYNGTTWDRVRAGLTGIVSSVVGFLNMLPYVSYTSLPTLTPGQSTSLQGDVKGLLRVALNVPNDGTAISNKSDNSDNGAVSATGDKLGVVNRNTRFNGTSWDREYNNQDVILLASAAHTTTQTSADQVNYNNRAINVVVDVTAIGTGSITCAINYKDPASGKYIALLTGAAITTNSTNMYTVCPGIAAVANVSANAVVPRTFQVVITANNANSVTYSVGYSLTR